MTPRLRTQIAAAALALVFAAHWHVHVGYLRRLDTASVLAAPARREITPFVFAPARRVRIVLVDGLRFDRAMAIPEMRALAAEGASRPMMAQFPSFTFASMTSLATGRPPLWSGVRINGPHPVIPWDSVALEARAAGKTVALADVGGDFEVLPGLLHLPPDAARLDLATLVANTAGGPDLAYVYFGDVDGESHAHGLDSPEYREAAAHAGKIVAQVRASLDLAQDAIFVASDHGHIDRGGHGGIEPQALTATFIAAGPGIRHGLLPPGAMRDFAATVAIAAGLPIPKDSIGRPMEDVLGAGPPRGDDEARADYAAAFQGTLRRARGRMAIASVLIAILAMIAGIRAKRAGLALRARDFLPLLIFLLIFAIGYRARGLGLSWTLGRSQAGYQLETACVSALAVALALYASRRERALEELVPIVALFGSAYLLAAAWIGWDLRYLPDPFMSFFFLVIVTLLFYAGAAFALRVLVIDRALRPWHAGVCIVLFVVPFLLRLYLPF